MNTQGEREMKLLLVDDEKRILEIFSALLQDYGYSVRTASEPESALRFVQETHFDIAFVDQFLGRAKGLDLIGTMSEIDPEISCVIMTANANTEFALQCLKRGAADFVSKPFFIGDLVKSIDYVDKKKSLETQRKEILASLGMRLEEKTREIKNVYFSVLTSLAQAMEKKDTGTYGHSLRVKDYSQLIARELHLPPGEQENLKAAAMLHDIGKIGTSDFILGKPGPLSPAELDDVRSHPRKGVEILKPLLENFPQFGSILPAILHHHESYNGSGYPAGLAGEEIPLLARIISVADTFDAIMSNRPYRQGSSAKKALSELRVCSGTQFDGHVVQAFEAALGRSRGSDAASAIYEFRGFLPAE